MSFYPGQSYVVPSYGTNYATYAPTYATTYA